jgi:HEAT repeat protein
MEVFACEKRPCYFAPMETPPQKRKHGRRRRMWALFAVFSLLWIGLRALNRPELTYADQPLSYWMERIGNDQTAADATSVLNEMGPEALPALIEALQTESSWAKDLMYGIAQRAHLAPPRNFDAPNVRATSAYLLGQMGRQAAPAANALIKALGDEDSFVRFKASRALSRIGMPAVAHLTLALRSQEAVVRFGAAKALGGMGAHAKYAVPALMRRLRDPQQNVRDAAFHALSQIGANAQKGFSPNHLPQLVEALTNSTWTASRRFAVQTLKGFGPKAKPALPALLSAKESWPELAVEIQEALAVIGK